MSIWTAVAIAAIFVAIGVFILWRRGKLSPKAAAFVDTAVKKAESFEDRVHNWAPLKAAPPIPSAAASQAISPSVVAVGGAPIAASDPSGTVVAPAPVTTGVPKMTARSKWNEGQLIQTWLNGEQDSWGKWIIIGAHPNSGVPVDPLAQYWQDHPELGEGTPSYEAAYQAYVAAHPPGVTPPPVQHVGIIPLAQATPDDFYYCYKLAQTGRDIATILATAFSGDSAAIGSAFNAQIVDNQPTAIAFDPTTYAGPLAGKL